MWRVVSIFLVTVALVTGIELGVHASPIIPASELAGIRTHYFELTVSPTEVSATIGQQIEIRCTVECLINTVVEIGSVDVLIFGSCGHMIAEQTMTKDSYWSFHTVYTIVGDEAYYQMKLTFTIRDDPSGEHSEYGIHSFPIEVKT